MDRINEQSLSIWRRTVSLGWPVAVEQALSTLMRTVDIIVTGLFSPVAVAAVGLGDLYTQIPLRIGQGLGAGAIAISSQDTGRGATLTRNRAITQALIIGVLCGLPFILVGLLFGEFLIAILGAESQVVRLGSLYLALVLMGAPGRIVEIVSARALQGTGDTKTPMYVNGSTNALNILLTVSLGLGIGAAPRLGIIGVGLGTAMSRTVGAVVLGSIFLSSRTEISFVWPRDITITKQLITVSMPRFAEGMSTSLANFPFNALILLFGTEANAAYHIGRRIYFQLIGPFSRSLSRTTSIIVGQTLGEGDLDGARFAAARIFILSLALFSLLGVTLFAGAEYFVRIFTEDLTTVRFAMDYTRTFAVSLLFFAVFIPLAGTLRGAGDTRTPFYARLIGIFVFMLGASYVIAVVLGFGLLGIYIGIFLSHACQAAIATAGFHWGGWQDLAAKMMKDRAQTP